MQGHRTDKKYILLRIPDSIPTGFVIYLLPGNDGTLLGGVITTKVRYFFNNNYYFLFVR